MPHDFAGKGVLNVLGGVPSKWFCRFWAITLSALHLVVNWPVLPFICCNVDKRFDRWGLYLASWRLLDIWRMWAVKISNFSQIQRDGRPPSWKIDKRLYLGNVLIDQCKIWQLSVNALDLHCDSGSNAYVCIFGASKAFGRVDCSNLFMSQHSRLSTTTAVVLVLFLIWKKGLTVNVRIYNP